MEDIYKGLTVLSGITIIIGILFGANAANGFIKFVVGLIDGVATILTSIISVLL